MLGGFGFSSSPTNQPIYNPQDPQTFNNADGWPDDISDGPVTARVTMKEFLRRWVLGDFLDDFDPNARPPQKIEEVPVADQPAALDRAALDFCLADAFHPGCEMTWPMRHTSMYSAPYRIRHRPAGEPEPDYGSNLSQANALAGRRPALRPGARLSRWMALPWQADTAFCRSGYAPAYDPYLPTFWPARVPNNVLSEEDYRWRSPPRGHGRNASQPSGAASSGFVR